MEEMCLRNANNFAVYIGHLYMHVTEFRISHLFLGVYIDPPAMIIAQ